MACLDMYNSDHKSLHHRGPASPRISFSSDFVDIQQSLKHQDRSPPPPADSSDFEFSVSNYSMMTADQLFFEGRLLPFNDSHSHHFHRTPTTLRDELLVEEEHEHEHDDDDVSQRRSKAGWKGFLGLKKSHNATKKGYRNEGSSSGHGTSHGTRSPNSSQVQNEGGSSCKDVEIDF